MRAIAVGLVILYHAGVPFLSGGYVGVDVFFVLSGFLITGLIVREMERSGTVDLIRFYARRIRRLLPASIVALVGVVGIALTMLPVTRWRGVSGDVIWSSLYTVNWRFAGQAVDYLASDEAASPVLHFWSLAVEEQFYLVWPFLLVMATFLARRRLRDVRRPLMIGLLLVAVPSLVWSVYLAQSNPGSAYFVTTTRMWELAVGGGLAILAPRLMRMPKALAETIALFGLVGIVAAAVIYSASTNFPGYAALLPVLSAGAVVASGTAHQDTIAARSLSWRPLVIIGGLSYALYLWHWPVLVGADALWGPLSVTAGLSFALLSAIPAWLSHTYVEQPLRRSAKIITPPVRGLVFGLALTGVGVAAGLWLWNSIPDSNAAPVAASEVQRTSPEISAETDEQLPEATSEIPTTSFVTAGEADLERPILVQTSSLAIYPDPIVAGDDKPSVYEDGCHQNGKSSEPIFCEFGPVDGPLVVLVGDSHAALWIPAVTVLAEEHGLRLRTYTKSACPFVGPSLLTGKEKAYGNCAEWNERVVAELVDNVRPDLVITSTRSKVKPTANSGEVISGEDPVEQWASGFAERWGEIVAADLPLVVIRDVPNPGFDVPECVVTHEAHLNECAFDREEATVGSIVQLEAADLLGIAIVDMTDNICGSELCPAVIEDVLVWRDNHHLSATYAASLAPVLGRRLGEWLDFG